MRIYPIYLLALLSFSPAWGAQELRVAAGAAPLENIFKRIEEPFEKATGISLTLIKMTHVTSLKALEDGKADVASVAFSFKEWLKRAEKDGLKLDTPVDELKYRTIGKDLLTTIVNGKNDVKGLSLDHLKSIFSGQATNWKELGSIDAPVVPVVSSKLPGLTNLYKDLFTSGQFGANTRTVETEIAGLVEAVIATPGAIAIVPYGTELGAAKAVKTPDIGRPVVAVTKGAPSAEAQKLFKFIAVEGPKYVR